jgi:hypothetical protein
MIIVVLRALATTLILMPGSDIHGRHPRPSLSRGKRRDLSQQPRRHCSPSFTMGREPGGPGGEGPGWGREGVGALLKEAVWLACEEARCGRRCALMEVKWRAAYADSLHV